MEQKNYKGLPNIGATCYINSFLQTLFLTPQFRDGIYEWTYNEKIHPKRQDSILFQLQKLFAKLQLGFSEISTKQLIKSFQWQEDQANDQQDIQQFNRVLFEAIEKSLTSTKGNNRHLIKQLYEGELAHFTKCLQCHNQSIREQTFQDIILIIKNVYEKIYNDSIELSLQRYIKPELLDQNNLYDCSICNKKVRAQRGIKFIKLPKLLNIVLQRFSFDYDTMTRNKINDRFTFPFVFNFNNYFNGYQQIPNKLNQDTSKHFLQSQVTKKVITKMPAVPRNKLVVKNGQVQPSVVGKVKTKPSANTKSFLQQMRKKKMQQNMENNQDLIYVSGNATAPQQSLNQISQSQYTQDNSKNLEAKQTQFKGKISENNLILPPPPPPQFLITLAPPSLSVPYNPTSIALKKQTSIQKIAQNKVIDKQQLSLQRQKQLNEQQLKNKSQIQVYLKDGPLVYELYSILVHNGTSNAGHYVSYIKSFEDDRWYSFNDERVTQINISEIDKTYGGNGISSAYVLYYRLVQQQKYKLQYKIPDYIRNIIKQQQQHNKIRQIQKISNIQNTLILKVYYQLGVKTIQILKSSPLQLLFQKSKEIFNIQIIKETNQITYTQQTTSYIKQQNLRIRLFNPLNQTKLDTFTGKQKMSLTELGIKSYQNFLLEIKADSQEFQDFIPGFITIRIALWQDNPHVISLDQKDIIFHKVSINRFSTMLQIEQIIKQKRQILRKQKQTQISQNICIIKRHQNDQYLYHEIINLPDYHTKNIDQVGIFEGQILFIQADSNNLNWPIEFQNQIHRINVKFIHEGRQQTITTDSRILLSKLKQQLCQFINQPADQTIIRRGNKSGLELKNGELTLKENRFISGTTLYLQKGIPAKTGQIRIQLFLSQNARVELFNRLHEFQFIADVPIDLNLKASEVKNIFIKILKKQRGIQLQASKIRIRQKVNDKMGKIYRQKPMKQQQIIEKRQIAIELQYDNLDIKDYSIYIRIWDQQNWKLSQKYQFLVSKNTTIKTLAMQIHQVLKKETIKFIIEPQQMDVCRILSIHKFNIIDLVDMEYFGMMSDVSVLGEPLFVNSDGLLYVVKQTAIQPRPLTKQEERIFGGQIKNVIRPTKGRPTSINTTKKQKGITIKVIQKIDQSQVQNK